MRTKQKSDELCFKDSGKLISIKTEVEKVSEILDEDGRDDGIEKKC